MLRLKLTFQKYYLKILRFFMPCLTCLVLLITCCFPVGASDYVPTPHSYLDYYSSHYDFGDGMIGVEMTIPMNGAQTLHKAFNSSYVYSNYVTSGSIAYFPYTQANRYKANDILQAQVYPMGYFTNSSTDGLDHTISLKGIPSGSMFSVIINPWILQDFITVDRFVHYVYIQYYDANGINLSGGHTLDPVEQSDHWEIATGELNPPSGAVAFRIVYKLQLVIEEMWPDPYDEVWTVELGMTDLRMRVIVPEAEYREAVDNRRHDDVVNGFNDVNSKLDQIEGALDGLYEEMHELQDKKVDALSPDSSNVSVRVDEVEGEVLDDTGEGFQQLEDITDSGHTSLITYLRSLLAVTWLLELLISIGHIQNLLYLSLAFGLCSFILGITNMIARSHTMKKGDN